VRIEAGLKRRLTALNLFINDIYNEQRVVIVPSTGRGGRLNEHASSAPT
jgi:hypothetical protein